MPGGQRSSVSVIERKYRRLSRRIRAGIGNGRPKFGTVADIFSFHHARRFWVLASFSLRSGAHVATYAPLRCSRKPRQNRKLAGRAFLKVLAMVMIQALYTSFECSCAYYYSGQ